MIRVFGGILGLFFGLTDIGTLAVVGEDDFVLLSGLVVERNSQLMG